MDRRIPSTLLAVALLAASCGDDATGTDGAAPSTTAAAVIDPGDGGDHAPQLDPADFVRGVDHPFLPFAPGNRWVDEETGE
ncbi:MAG TPA: hypothetical protein VD926_01680, partial [Acidimicrobiales bacterium]|nr:hypothetical protein [Acidimicrobiales bacterium]